MKWQHYLKTKTRQPEFLWRMVLSIIGAGVVLGVLTQWITGSGAAEPAIEASEPVEADSPWQQINTWAQAGQWSRVWWGLPATQTWRFQTPGTVALAALACCCWLAFLLQTMRAMRAERILLAMIAVGLGVLSIWFNAFFALWQEHRWNMTESDQLMGGVRYYVLGVGLREETAKAICFLPLLPWLLRRHSELTTLIIAGCVGIGFAMFENTGYLMASGGAAATGRFLTANPAHMALTALIGLALYRAARNPQAYASHALATFAIMVCVHGSYDALIAVPALAEYSMGSTIMFILLLYQFFQELRQLRPNGTETVSLTANFLFGLSILSAATFVYLSGTLGYRLAAIGLADDITGLAIIAYVFLREMPETLVQ